MSDHVQRPDSPIWRQIIGTIWRVEKETWREAALIGLVGGVIGAGAAGTPTRQRIDTHPDLTGNVFQAGALRRQQPRHRFGLEGP